MAITINGYNENIAANAVSADLMSGEKGRFVNVGDEINLYAVSSAITMQLSFGTANDTFIDFKNQTFVGTTLVKKDHLVGSFTATQEGELSLRLRETGGIATTDTIFSVEVLKYGVDI